MVPSNIFERRGNYRIPFLPIIYRIAAKFEQISLKDMAENPGNLCRCLKNCHKLFGYDAILNNFDENLEAQACGCKVEWRHRGIKLAENILAKDEMAMRFDPSGFQTRGRIPIVVEATKRLRIEMGGVAAIAGVITGPYTIASLLRGPKLSGDLKEGAKPGKRVVENAIEVANTMARLYCDVGVDILVIREDIHDGGDSHLADILAEGTRAISNIANYYRTKTILMAGGLVYPSLIEKIFHLPLDAFYISDNSQMNMVGRKAIEHGKPYGIGFPFEVLLKGAKDVEDYIERLIGAADDNLMFLTTEWEVPWEVEAESIHAITKGISRFDAMV